MTAICTVLLDNAIHSQTGSLLQGPKVGSKSPPENATNVISLDISLCLPVFHFLIAYPKPPKSVGGDVCSIVLGKSKLHRVLNGNNIMTITTLPV